jgi:hypothetical protein
MKIEKRFFLHNWKKDIRLLNSIDMVDVFWLQKLHYLNDLNQEQSEALFIQM